MGIPSCCVPGPIIKSRFPWAQHTPGKCLWGNLQRLCQCKPEAMAAAADFFSKGIECVSERHVRAALPLFNQAEELGYDRNACSAQRWQCWILLGDFERAWAESDELIARGAPDEHR